ncbi:hypothetical protein [Streptomyces sp. AGS-58]|uniref:hypothetical protein n=1 Tax=unclassified Streptomyces TaxID=2593676 RepID=UPI0035A38150
MDLRTKGAAALVATALTVVSGIGISATPASASTTAPASVAAKKKCSADVDQPWSGGGRAYTYGWNTCSFAGWTSFRLFRYTNGKYRQVAQSGTYWSKFKGRSISAKCLRGGHWYVAEMLQDNVLGQESEWWSPAAWLGSC